MLRRHFIDLLDDRTDVGVLPQSSDFTVITVLATLAALLIVVLAIVLVVLKRKKHRYQRL